MQPSTDEFREAEGRPLASWLTFGSALLFLIANLLRLQVAAAQQARPTDAAGEGRIRQVIDGLPEASILRNELQLGHRGDGIRQPWMDEIRHLGIKQVSSGVHMSWSKGRGSPRLVGLHYFSEYDRSNSEIDEKARLAQIRADHLDSELAQAILNTAMAYSSEPSVTRPCQQLGVSIFDDEWLPPIVAVPDLNSGIETNLEDTIRKGNLDLARSLLDRGVDVNERDVCGRTALFDAVAGDNVQLCRVLLDKGADTRMKDENGWTALLNAAWFGRVEQLELLVGHGAPIDAADNDGQTALIVAAERGNSKVVQALLAKHPNIHARDNSGQTALSVAESKGYTEIVELLKRAGVSR